MIGVDGVANVLLLILDEKGDRTMNPMSGSGTCLYTDWEHQDWHCLVGEYFEWIGREAPDASVEASVEDSEVTENWLQDHTPEAISFLGLCQQDADNGTSEGNSWSGALDFDHNYDLAKGII